MCCLNGRVLSLNDHEAWSECEQYTTKPKQSVFVQLHKINYDYDAKLLTLAVVRHKRYPSHFTHFSGFAHTGDKGHAVGNFTGTIGDCRGAKQC